MRCSPHLVLPFLALITFGAAQTSVDSLTCVPGSGVTALNTCDTFSSELARCNSTTTKQDYINCLCTQSFFNLIVEYVYPLWLLQNLIFFSCESESRLCSGGTQFDSLSEE